MSAKKDIIRKLALAHSSIYQVSTVCITVICGYVTLPVEMSGFKVVEINKQFAQKRAHTQYMMPLTKYLLNE